MTLTNTDSSSYDAMGNATSYSGATLSWEGKQLTGYTKGNKNLSFAYDENGLRTQKTVNGETINYYYNDSLLMGMSDGYIKQRFSYDTNGNVVSVDVSFSQNTFTTYYYLRNAQGDTVKLIDKTGTAVVEYTYDTWGKLLSTTGSLSEIFGKEQPFRYRGYVYDEETGWYYLQSRYYNPEIGKFISSDVYLSTGQGVLGHNAYAYCLNNPVNGYDPHGFRIINAANYLLVFSSCNGNSENSSDDEYDPPDNQVIIGSIPLHGPPNSYADRGKGQWRYYDSNGRAYEDYDRPHNGHNYWHKHKFKWNGEDHDRGHEIPADPPEKNTKNNCCNDKIFGCVIIVTATIGIAFLIADDLTGLGGIDDGLIPFFPGGLCKEWH